MIFSGESGLITRAATADYCVGACHDAIITGVAMLNPPKFEHVIFSNIASAVPDRAPIQPGECGATARDNTPLPLLGD